LHTEVDHGGDFADELDLEAVVGRVQHDPLDQPAQDLQGFGLGRRLGERRLQVGDLAAVDLGQVGMEPRRRRRDGGQLGLQRRRYSSSSRLAWSPGGRSSVPERHLDWLNAVLAERVTSQRYQPAVTT
jgi:hypothetical protein